MLSPALPATLLAALVAALVGTPHCLGMCGGFAAAAASSPMELAAYHLGKTVTYAVLGALAGTFGAALSAIPGLEFLGVAVAAVFLVWFSAALAGLLPEPSLPIPGLEKLGIRTAGARGVPARFLFGLVNGLLPCGLLYATVGMAVGAGGPLEGALTLVVFGLATVPGLTAAALGLRQLLGRHPWTRRVLAALVLIAGLGGLGWRYLA